MRFRCLAFVASVLACCACAAACGSSSNNATTSPTPGMPSGDADTTESGAADATDGASGPGFPGNPSSGMAAAVVVTINGQVRTFDGEAGWSKSFPDGGTLVGFQTNAHDGKDWTFVLGVFGHTAGTYTCSGDPRAGLGITNQIKSDGGIDETGIDYGGTVTTEDCSVTLVSYGPNKGDHVTGTFTGVLRLSSGFDKTMIDTLNLTDGRFDLVQFADTPP